jgi:ABC-type sugar transport system ATPase subunit
MERTEEKYVLEMREIDKYFTGVHALKSVSMRLREGTCLVIMGENGAGKSTLLKILTGVYEADKGEVLLRGEAVQIKDAHDAFERGISIVHQERNLFSTLSIAANVYIHQLTRKALKNVDYAKYETPAKKYLEMVNLSVSPADDLASLSAGQQQLVEIARALALEAKIIVLDEPTASISLAEANNLISISTVSKRRGIPLSLLAIK